MSASFYSNGKLLLTGEYVVLDGAEALALPTTFGQRLTIISNTPKQITWKSYDSDGSLWIDTDFKFSDICIPKDKNDKVVSKLIEILVECQRLNPGFLTPDKGYTFTTELTFPRFWGLGSSSTLIANLAKWLSINPYDLLRNTFGGSGYDLACASSDGPIIYRLEQGSPQIKEVAFEPDFSEHLYFVYLGRKQNSREAIAQYASKRREIAKTISDIDQITKQIIKSSEIGEFSDLLNQHEIIMSKVLGEPGIRQKYFSDFEGTLKSLGAWGGDFMLAVSLTDPTRYFKDKGLHTILRYQDMILNKKSRS